MEVVNRNDVEPFITKDQSEIRNILSPDNSSIRNQSLAEALLLPGQATEEHRHPISEEIYYIQSGYGRMRIAGEERDVKPLDGIAIRPGVLHRIWNTGDEPLTFLCCCSPAYSNEDTELEG
jgi:mannose-6-phosphate isomerase-like protein (cupin superfamily)